MSERFFSVTPISTALVTLDGAEAHHLLHVMRAKAGDTVTVFDGGGDEFTAVVESLNRSAVTLRVKERFEVDRELTFPLTVGVALPKGDRQRWLVEKLTELGVTELVPLEMDRGVAQPAMAALERLRRAVVEACKQCGRNRLMRIGEPQRWHDWISRKSPTSSGSGEFSGDVPVEIRRLVAHPGGLPIHRVNLGRRLPTLLAIGPEGGFTASDVQAAVDAGWQLVDLGPRILRVETAATALAAAVALVVPPLAGP